MPFGKIEPFDLFGGKWSLYVRRVEQFIFLNEIKSTHKVATLVTLVGERTYNLMCDLCAPNKPEEKTFEELVTIVKNHLEPQRSIYVEREVFRQRKQKAGESILEFLQQLKHLATECKFGQNLEENLCEQFLTGLQSTDIKARLLVETNLTYKKAVELALGLEAAEKHVDRVSGRNSLGGAYSGDFGSNIGAGAGSAAGPGGAAGSSAAGGSGEAGGEALHALRGGPAGRARPAASSALCWRCGKPHRADKCRYKQYNCDLCLRRGHLKVMCKAANKTAEKRHNFMSDDSESEMYKIRAVASGDKPFFINVKIGNKILKCELDTGSKISAISERCYNSMFSNYTILKDEIKLCSYSGSRIEPIGFILVDACIEDNHQQNLQLYIIKNGSRPLLGRSWIQKFKINELCINNILQEDSDNEYRDRFINELKTEYSSVFTDKLGECKKQIRLQLTDNKPVFVRARPVPLALRSAVEREIKRLEKEGSIYPVEHSDYGTPIVPVIKPSGDIRLCGDYKSTINPKLKMDHYPLPRIEELFAALSGGQEYSKIDLTTAYMQVPLHPESQACTAISTHIGTYAFKRTPYGLNCVPQKFQKIMEETLRGLPNTVVFLDDICITGKDRETHKNNLRAVIERLATMGLTVKINKCKFLQKSVSYLGFIIDKHGLHPDMTKVEAIVKAPTPGNVTQLKAFLGLINYYGKFVPNLSSLLHPLYSLLKKNQPWNWDINCEDAFINIKNILASDRVLCHYDPALPLVLSVDSSSYGIGAVLAHVFADGTERPISCASRTLGDTEKNYSQLDKEALAIMYGVQKHHQYLFGRKFILKTDHKPLVYIFGPKGGIPQTAASRLQRWAAKLAAYDFDINYVKSKCNGNADALSRLPLEGKKHNSPVKSENHYLLYMNETLPVSYKEIAVEIKKDNLLSRIYGYIMFGWPEKCKEDEQAFFVRRAELYIDHGCILYKYRLIIPQSLQERVLFEIHSGHLGIVKMKSIARNYVYWPSIDKDIESVGQKCEACRNVRDAPPKTTLHPWEFPAGPWKRLHADFAQFHGKYYIVVVDAYSKWLEVEQIRSTAAYDTIKFFRSLFSRFGLIDQLVTDNGPPFQSAEFKEFCSKNIIRHVTSSPYRPQGNGAAENAVKTVKKTIKKAVLEGEDIHASLCRFLLQYRNCPHATTGVEPAVALLGRRLRNRLDAMRPSTSKIVADAQSKQIESSGGVVRKFDIGDKILTRNYSTKDNKWIEGDIIEKTGPVSYKILLNKGNICRRLTDQILPLRNSRFSWNVGPGSEPESTEITDQYVNTRPRRRNQNAKESYSPGKDVEESTT
ncbi:uncharacterized protein K02A2.6-like [Maniola jurtina]|uniref:uncharacterized protein K02A2.6-like n=1 Tax=Maniola jurtina TaxID=191418 RepID=UPI001E689077|nr:uncharacterized protein K02A2.6-like [Maniola jurtina]